jgi:hypothetical protein
VQCMVAGCAVCANTTMGGASNAKAAVRNRTRMLPSKRLILFETRIWPLKGLIAKLGLLRSECGDYKGHKSMKRYILSSKRAGYGSTGDLRDTELD